MARARERKASLIAVYGDKCFKCGGTFPACCYDFHHLWGNDAENGKGPSYKITTASEKDFEKKVFPEIIQTCVMLCANCHRIVTWEKKNGASR